MRNYFIICIVALLSACGGADTECEMLGYPGVAVLVCVDSDWTLMHAQEDVTILHSDRLGAWQIKATNQQHVAMHHAYEYKGVAYTNYALHTLGPADDGHVSTMCAADGIMYWVLGGCEN